MTLVVSNFTGTKRISSTATPSGYQDLRYVENVQSNTAPQFLYPTIIPEHSSGTKIIEMVGEYFSTTDVSTQTAINEPFLRNKLLNFDIIYSPSQLIENYVSGEMDIPDIVRYLGAGWDESKVVLFLEQNNVKRPLSMQKLSSGDKNNLLHKLAYIRGTVEIQEYNSDEWILREVVATQRIESIYVNPKN